MESMTMRTATSRSKTVFVNFFYKSSFSVPPSRSHSQSSITSEMGDLHMSSQSTVSEGSRAATGEEEEVLEEANPNELFFMQWVTVILNILPKLHPVQEAREESEDGKDDHWNAYSCWKVWILLPSIFLMHTVQEVVQWWYIDAQIEPTRLWVCLSGNDTMWSFIADKWRDTMWC